MAARKLLRAAVLGTGLRTYQVILTQTVGVLFALPARANTVESPAMTDPDEQRYCEYDQCRKPLDHRSTQGRRRRYCDAKCRSAARRQRDAAQATATPPALAFARVLNAAIEDDGRSLRTLSAALPRRSFVSPAALSQWQNGRAVPRVNHDNINRVYALERLFNVQAGTMLVPFCRSNGLSDVPPSAMIPQPRQPEDHSAKTLEQAARQLERRIASLHGSDNSALPLVASWDSYFVSSQRWPMRSIVELTVNPLRDGIRHYWVIFADSERAPLTVEPRSGCNSGDVLHNIPPIDVDGHKEILVANELTFPPLKADNEYTFSFEMKYGRVQSGELPLPRFRRFVTTPTVREVRLDIQFEGQPPRDLRSARWNLTPANDPPLEEVDVKVDADGRGEPLVLINPEPGAYGYTWKWHLDTESLA